VFAPFPRIHAPRAPVIIAAEVVMHWSPLLSRIFWLLYIGWIASEIFIGLGTRTGKKGGTTHDRGSQLILWVAICTASTLCFVTTGSRAPEFFGGSLESIFYIRTAALLILILGLAVRWTAILTLGRAFSANVAIRDKQQLRTTGLYAIVRHPSYLGMEIIFVAIGLYAGNWLALAIMLIPTTAAVIYRIHVEEIALRAAFGQQYIAYSVKTKRLLPAIY
jgi:protein-S-isoprenylcysteine O-methyltransferase Ste14